MVVVPNTVKIADFTSHPISEEIVQRMEGFYNIVYIGDTSIRRGTDTAIRAMALIKDNVPNARLWLVGKSSADEELKALSGNLGVTETVTMEGWQSPALLPSYLRSASVGLSPLRKNRHHDTTYANKLFQYMIFGIPLVVSGSRAQADLVELEKCGLVHQANDPESLAEKILFLHSNTDIASAMGERGKNAVVSKWNWDETVKDLIDMYDKDTNTLFS